MSSSNAERCCFGPQRSPTLDDRLALWLLKLAKLHRQPLKSASKQSYHHFYEEFFEQKDVAAYDQDPRMVVRRQTIVDVLQRFAPPDPSVLDVGCGLGDVLLGLPDNCRRWGIDCAHSNVQIAQSRLGERAYVVQGSIYQLPYRHNQFDVCLCLEVLEHVENDVQAVREIARVLKPGGFLIGAVPYTYYWADYLRLMGHFRHYTRESFSRLLDQNGLRTEEFLPNYPNWHQLFTRRYAFVRAQAKVFGRLFGCDSLYRFKWPWQHQPALKRLEAQLEPLKQRDMAQPYATLQSSTFLLARKALDG